MGKSICFSNHAEKWLSQRTSLSKEEVTKFLEQGRTIPIGIENKSSIIHHLFYSLKDQEHFIAILSEKSKTIITILPQSLYYRWKISLETRDRAVKMAQPVCTIFRLMGYLHSNGSVKAIGFGNWASYLYDQPQSLLNDKVFLDHFREKIRTCVDNPDSLTTIYIKVRNDLVSLDDQLVSQLTH